MNVHCGKEDVCWMYRENPSTTKVRCMRNHPGCATCSSDTRSRSIAASQPTPERIGSTRTLVLQEDAYMIERVNAGMGEWEYVIQYCGEYYATAPTEEIARSIVEMAQHTCPVLTPMHDAAIRNEVLDDICKNCGAKECGACVSIDCPVGSYKSTTSTTADKGGE